MNKSLLLIYVIMLLGLAANAQNSPNFNGTEIKEGQTASAEPMINGYPAKNYYYNTVTLPPDIAASTEKPNRIKVAFHYKLVAWEKANQRPLTSLPKNEMEALLTRLNNEAHADIEGEGKTPAPQH